MRTPTWTLAKALSVAILGNDDVKDLAVARKPLSRGSKCRQRAALRNWREWERLVLISRIGAEDARLRVADIHVENR